MRTYEIQKLHDETYPYIVLSTSFNNPLDEINCIEVELKDNYIGKVIFDLLLTNGLSSNRFIEAQFDGAKFDKSSFKSIKIIDDFIKAQLIEFYKNNVQYVDKSVLSQLHKFMLKKGKLLH
jgi:hypothetical protein